MKNGTSPLRRLALPAVLLLTFTVALVVFLPRETEAQSATKEVSTHLELNETVSGRVPVIPGSPSSTSYRISVPEDVFALTLEIENAPADLDILLLDSLGHEVALAEEMLFNEILTLSRITYPALEAGDYVVEILYQYSRPPVVQDVQLAEIPFDLTARTVVPRIRQTIRPGSSVRGTLHPDRGMIEIYRIEVPTGTVALRIDVSDTDGDVDLFLSSGKIPVDPYGADFVADSIRSTEQIVLDRSSDPSLRPGTWYLMVLDQLSDLYPVDYTLTIHDGRDAPAVLQEQDLTVTPPRDAPMLEHALRAVVEVLTVDGGGSGVVVSPAGHIITNKHVITADSGLLEEDLVIAFTLDPARPARELFRAELVEVARDRDMALLQITSGRYHQPLPSGQTFPWVALGDDRSLVITDPLHLFGYPSIGSTTSRTTLTYSSGSVAGFQQVPFGRLIKTDGLISGGNSGGAALDGDYNLVGMPTEIVSFGATQIGYVYPVSAIPPAWLQAIRAGGGDAEELPGGAARR